MTSSPRRRQNRPVTYAMSALIFIGTCAATGPAIAQPPAAGRSAGNHRSADEFDRCKKAPRRRNLPSRGPSARQRPPFSDDRIMRAFLFGPAAMPPPPPVSPLVLALDRNGDGRITREELRQVEAIMRQLDLNHDGRIGPVEWSPRHPSRIHPAKTDRRFSGRNRGIAPESTSPRDDRPERSKKSRPKRVHRKSAAESPAPFQQLDTE